jgi:hypothetical protein
MGINIGKVSKLINEITKESKNVEEFHTGMVGENIFIASYQRLPVEKLEQIRYIINKIIKKKKELRRVQNAEHKTPKD